MDRSRIALIIPALNEATSIQNVVARSFAHGVPIVVDDGSTDGTGERAREAGAEVVRHTRNRGYDAALDSGFARAAAMGFEWAVTLDADGQHDPATLVRVLAALAEGADVVVGERDRLQRISERLFAWAGIRLWGLRDPLCGMKGYRMSVHAAHGAFDTCGSIGTELAIFAMVRGDDVRQVPVPTRPRRGAPRFGSGFCANWRITRALVMMVLKARGWRTTAGQSGGRDPEARG